MMNKSPHHAAVLFLAMAISLTSCTSPAEKRETFIRNIRSIAYHQAERYKGTADLSPSPVPEFLLEALRSMDGIDSYASYELNESERLKYDHVMRQVPPSWQRLLEENMAGIFFVNDFLGGGMLDYVFSTDGRISFILILNPATLDRNLDEWLTYRDSSIFENGNSSLSVSTGSDAPGFLHTLIHETSHLVDYLYHITPATEESLAFMNPGVTSTPFTQGVWDGYRTPVPAADFAGRSGIHAYGLGQTIPNTEMQPMMESLIHSPFASLYGSVNQAEDFAETMTWKVIGDMGIHYTVTLTSPVGGTVTYHPDRNPIHTQRRSLLPVP